MVFVKVHKCRKIKPENEKRQQHLLPPEDSVLDTDALSGPMSVAYLHTKQKRHNRGILSAFGRSDSNLVF